VKYLLLVYIDHALLDALPEGEFDSMMRGCLAHADELKRTGVLLETQMLEDAHTARTVRVRNGRMNATDGPFAETKEVLGGFNLIEAESLAEAERIAASFPWIRTGSLEVRPVREVAAVRKRVGAA
jgi:hypothetical protein